MFRRSSKKDAQRKRKEVIQTIEEKLKNVILFPGNIKEYENFMGYKAGTIKAIDTKRQDKSVFIKHDCDIDFFRYLFSEGFEALVDLKYKPVFGDDGRPYGLPVRKVRE